MGILILLRHGSSIWNAQGRFTGSVDVVLSREGIEESFLVGEKLSQHCFSRVFVSGLVRSQMTAYLVLSRNCAQKDKSAIFFSCDVWQKRSLHSCMAEKEIMPIVASSALNERCYGVLQGRKKVDVAREFGEKQVFLWRRGYKDVPPNGESLEMTFLRVLPFFQEEIASKVINGETILLCAHGNSLRAVMMHLEKMSSNHIQHVEIATGSFLSYRYDNGKWSRVE